jgi:hypothetical protein
MAEEQGIRGGHVGAYALQRGDYRRIRGLVVLIQIVLP